MKQVVPHSRCLILFAHGSKDPVWCDPFERLQREVALALAPQMVRLAYMEFRSPTLMEIAAECAGSGIGEVRILPLFLSAGAHMAKDVPEQAEQMRAMFPQIAVELLPAVGEDARVFGLLRRIAVEAAEYLSGFEAGPAGLGSQR